MKRAPWRFRCPEGHASISIGQTTIRCRACGETYPRDELQDLASG